MQSERKHKHKHIVSLSGGISSAIAAYRVIERYPGEKVDLWFADTSWEDPDLYRFLDDLENWFDLPITRYRDGRNPLEVCRDKKIIGNSKNAPCTFTLKINPFVQYLKGQLDLYNVSVYVGMDWTEMHRQRGPRKRYESIGVQVDFPLCWRPLWTAQDCERFLEAAGIRIPEMYLLGFSHNNCGGRCVKQGISQWKTLYHRYPDRYAEVEAWEAEMRETIDYTIVRDRKKGDIIPTPLSKLKERFESDQLDFTKEIEDVGCHCTY